MKTIIVLIIVALIVVYSLISLYKNFFGKNKGTCNCSGCNMSDSCTIKGKDEKKNFT